MGHHHGHGHSHDHTGEGAGSRLAVAFALNAVFAVIELVGAVLTNSTAIAADAVHDLGDSMALAFAWGMQGASQRGPDSTFTYGLRRLSVVGAVVNALVLVTGGAFILSQSIPRLWDPAEPHAEGMIGLAILGVLVNGAAVLRMRTGSTLNERVVFWHLMEDVLGWVAVLLASIAIAVWDLFILDPLLSIVITAWVGFNALKNLKKSLEVFMQAVPDDVNLADLHAQVEAVDGVCSLQHVHVWTSDGEHHVLTGTLVLESTDLSSALASRDEAQAVLERAGINHVTLALALKGEPGVDHCA